MSINNHINYIEFFVTDLTETKLFYGNCFGWEFEDFGPKYTAFSGSGVAGGFEFTDKPIIRGGVLVVIYHENLKEVEEVIKANGGKIVVPIFSFPGGSRFQFLDPSGNELSVWCHTQNQ